MMHMLGVLAEIFPLEITGKDATILNIFMANLKGEAWPTCLPLYSDSHTADEHAGNQERSQHNWRV